MESSNPMTPPLDDRSSTSAPPSISAFDKTILNSLSAHIAILDARGGIRETNRAWQSFGQTNGIEAAVDMVGLNYLDICDAAMGVEADYSHQAAAGIRSVIAREMDEFTMEYPCHSPTREMWFYMRATRVENAEPYFVVVVHEDITSLKLAEETIRQRETELFLKNQNLEEANTALKVLLKHREEDRKELEEKVVVNIEQLVSSYVEKMKSTRLDERQRTYLEIIESHLNDIVSPLLQKIASLHLQLTPQEIQVASLVKAGRSTKEIADILTISTNAVDFHRKNIRKKLGLSHKKTNLRTFLLSMA